MTQHFCHLTNNKYDRVSQTRDKEGKKKTNYDVNQEFLDVHQKLLFLFHFLTVYGLSIHPGHYHISWEWDVCVRSWSHWVLIGSKSVKRKLFVGSDDAGESLVVMCCQGFAYKWQAHPCLGTGRRDWYQTIPETTLTENSHLAVAASLRSSWQGQVPSAPPCLLWKQMRDVLIMEPQECTARHIYLLNHTTMRKRWGHIYERCYM